MLHEFQSIDAEIQALVLELYEAYSGYAEQVIGATRADLDYEIAKARAVDQVRQECEADGVKMTVAEKDALVVLRTASEAEAYKMADAGVDILKKKLHNIEARLSAVQSRAAMARVDAKESAYAA